MDRQLLEQQGSRWPEQLLAATLIANVPMLYPTDNGLHPAFEQ